MSAAPDWAGISRLIADGVRVDRGDRVSVFATDPSALPAVTAFVTEAFRRGAVPQVLLTDEAFDAAALAYADDAVLAEPLPLEAAAMRWSDVHASFRAMVPPHEASDDARAALLRRGRGVVSTMRWESTRWALVRIPTPGWAELIGTDADALMAEWARSFDADWTDARARMTELCGALETADRVLIRDADTELLLPTRGRRWVPFAGEANWPDGEVATAPLEDGVEGTIAFPGTTIYGGVRIRDLELEFRAGLAVRASAAEGEGFVRRLLDTDAGARRVGELGIGTNAALTTPVQDLLIDEKILGTVHIALGRAYPECGGVNRSALHWDIVKDLRGPSGTLAAGTIELIADGVCRPSLASAAVCAL